MKHLSGSLVALPQFPLDEIPDVNIRESEITYASGFTEQIKEIRTSTNCCVCKLSMWVQSYPNHSLLNGFKVVNNHAYADGIPNYLVNPKALLECHWSCKEELIYQLQSNTFLSFTIEEINLLPIK